MGKRLYNPDKKSKVTARAASADRLYYVSRQNVVEYGVAAKKYSTRLYRLHIGLRPAQMQSLFFRPILQYNKI